MIEGSISVKLIKQQALVGIHVRQRGNEHKVADTIHQQHGERIIDHGLVIDRDNWLGHGLRHGIEPAALATSENDTFHG